MMICDEEHKQRIHDGMIITVVVSSRKKQIILRKKNMILPHLASFS